MLDCTLRDGGYYNNWDFKFDFIQKYLNAIEKTNINYVEIGFRFNDQKKIKGLTGYTSDKLLNSLKIPNNILVGIMINASDLYTDEKFNLSNLKKLINSKSSKKIKFIRIACHYHEIIKIDKCIKYLKKLNLKIFINLMQISEIKNSQIKRVTQYLGKNSIEALYLADSLGSLSPKDIKQKVKYIKKLWRGDLGIHAHNNFNQALNNSITAINSGVKWVDSTITGMGRGPGNLKTEDILRYRKIKYSNSFFKVLDSFKNLKKKYKWGPNIYYKLAAKKKIHPTFVQKILSDSRYKKEDHSNLINLLGKSDARKFNPYKLINTAYFLKIKPRGYWKPSSLIKNKDILILGPGKNLIKSKVKIEKFIEKRDLFVIGLNIFKSIREELIKLRVSCHPFRLISDGPNYNKFKKKLVIPYSMLRDNLKKNIRLKNSFYDYGLSVANNKTIKIKNDHCILPFPLAVAYALSIAIAGKANSIMLAGFDGYKASDSDKDNTEEVFKIIKNRFIKKKITSLTKTNYKHLSYISKI
ncbi:hypothetical protein OA383_02950 [Candidatus Pelagibacter bacterium]|nr:hypothetical protein [Candidatus Pelagibacter bacterium]